MVTVVALIPARGGSQRIPRKNIKPLNGHPLLAYTIAAAKGSGIFTEVVVSTDDAEIANVAQQYGASVFMRHAEASSAQPDICWVREVLSARHNVQKREDCYAILRPTSPFRTAATIERAWWWFQNQQPCDSLRAVEAVKQHPGKMWVALRNNLPPRTIDPNSNPAIGDVFSRWRIQPLLNGKLDYLPAKGAETIGVPWHSCPTQSLGIVYAQNASLEMAWRYCALPPAVTVAGTFDYEGTISGIDVTPFFTVGYEGFDLNTREDWAKAETLTDYLPDLATGNTHVAEECHAQHDERHAGFKARGFTYTTYTC